MSDFGDTVLTPNPKTPKTLDFPPQNCLRFHLTFRLADKVRKPYGIRRNNTYFDIFIFLKWTHAMSGNNNKQAIKSTVIAVNKRASHDYFLEQHFEAGISLQGWEVKALRAGRASIVDGYVTIKKGEIYLIGANITPLDQACTHVICDPTRTRKLLLNRREIDKLIGSVERAGYTIVPLKLYWKKSLVKLEISLARGKQTHDKRDSIKEREWKRDQARVMKKSIR